MTEAVLSFDPATISRLAVVYPDLRVRWIRLANSFFNLHGMAIRVAQGLRTYGDQQKIYEIGRTFVAGRWAPEHPDDIDPSTGKSYGSGARVTWAKPGDSWHHFSAIDSAFSGADPYLEKHPNADFLWSEYARLARGFGFECGHDWPEPKQDKPHVQIRYGGMKLADAKLLYSTGGLVAVWSKFDSIRGIIQGSDWMDAQTQQLLRNVGAIA